MKHGTDVFLHNELHFITNTRIRPIYTVRFCRMRPPYYTLTTRFRPRLSYGFKHVLKSYDFISCRNIRRLHTTKSYRVNRPLDFFSCRKEVAYDKIARATYPYPCTENGYLKVSVFVKDTRSARDFVHAQCFDTPFNHFIFLSPLLRPLISSGDCGRWSKLISPRSTLISLGKSRNKVH